MVSNTNKNYYIESATVKARLKGKVNVCNW